TTSFAYFAVHGSVDWFWELPALGCLAFASLGIAAGLVPRPALPPRSRRGREPLARDPRALAALAVGAGLLAASFAAPWLAVRQTDSARSYFKGDPAQAKVALERLDSAAALNPFEPRPRILAAKIQIAVGRLDLAARDFRAALDRDPRYANADLLLASVLSMRGDRAGAERATAHAAGLSPRDPLAQDLLKTLRGGGRLDYYDVNARLQSRARDRVR
ncbi:MAG: hypothetical protein QOJ07_255, partial [Thermoleophilaceae bacterium]|nr:hypothetical protein [Thermoleophilaceae bacterium]